jgi:hypothetical protein
VRAAFGINAFVGEAQTLYGLAVDQVLLHYFSGILGRHVAIPDCLWVNHHRWTMLALIQAAGLVDAHRVSQTRGLGKLLQLRVQFAFPIGGT